MKKGRVLACSDIHGRYDLWSMVKEYLEPNDILYVLGDCCDRGPKGWDVMKEVYEHPQTIYLKGNHEDMFVKAIQGHDVEIHNWNGGKKTRTKWKYKDGGHMEWVNKLNNLPLEKVYYNNCGQRIILTHAGYTPTIGIKMFKDELLWDRYHIPDFWNEDFNDTIIIHGHTPISYMRDFMWMGQKREENGVFYYSYDKLNNPHKINIDCGAFFTGTLAVLDLDTLKPHIFKA